MFFKEQIKRRVSNEKGLTLIELLAVIVILAIIAAIAIPAIGNIISNSRDKAALSEAVNIISGAKIAYMDKACDGTATGDKTCDDENLGPYVDGVDLEDELLVTYDQTTKEWSIKSPELFGSVNEQGNFGTVYTGAATAFTETNLKTYLENGNDD